MGEPKKVKRICFSCLLLCIHSLKPAKAETGQEELEDEKQATRTVKKEASRKKAAKRPAAADAGDFMSLEVLHKQVASIAKALGPMSYHVGDLMNYMGYEDLTSVPDDKRQEVLDAVVTLERELKEEGAIEEEADEGFLG